MEKILCDAAEDNCSDHKQQGSCSWRRITLLCPRNARAATVTVRSTTLPCESLERLTVKSVLGAMISGSTAKKYWPMNPAFYKISQYLLAKLSEQGTSLLL